MALRRHDAPACLAKLSFCVLLLGGGAGGAQPADDRPAAAPRGGADEPAPAPLRLQPGARAEIEQELALGREYFKGQRYMDAAMQLKKAYLMDPRPIFLFNMAQAFRRAKRPRGALALYERYLLEDPQTRLRAETENNIAELRALIKEQEEAEEAARALRQQEERAERERQRMLREQEGVKKALLVEQRRAQALQRPVYRRPWFWGIMAGAAVVVGTSIGLGVGLGSGGTPTDGGVVPLTF